MFDISRGMPAKILGSILFIWATHSFFAISSMVYSDRSVWILGILFSCPLIVLLLIYGMACLNRGISHQYWNLTLLVLGFSFLLRLLWILYFNAQQVSDFHRYWECASHWISGEYIYQREDCYGPYIQRAAILFAPLQMLFGKSHLVFEFFNISIISLTSLLWFLYSKGVLLSSSLACLCLAYFYFSPDLLYVSTLASNDPAGLFVFVLMILVVTRISESSRGGRAEPFVNINSASLGVLLFLFDWIKGFATIALPALFVTALIADGQKCKKLIGLFFIPFAIFYLLNSFAWRKVDAISRLNVPLPAYFSSINIFSSGQYSERKQWYQDYYPLLPEEFKSSMTTRKIISELSASPLDTVAYVLRKNSRLARGDGFLSFSRATPRDLSVGRVNNTNGQAQRLAIHLISALLYVFVILGALSSPQLLQNRSTHFLITFSLLYLPSLLFLTEVQPRYDLYLLPLLSWLGAKGAQDLFQRELSFTLLLGNLRRVFVILLLGLLSLFAVDLLLRNTNLRLYEFDKAMALSAGESVADLLLTQTGEIIEQSFKGTEVVCKTGDFTADSLSCGFRLIGPRPSNGSSLNFFVSADLPQCLSEASSASARIYFRVEQGNSLNIPLSELKKPRFESFDLPIDNRSVNEIVLEATPLVSSFPSTCDTSTAIVIRFEYFFVE